MKNSKRSNCALRTAGIAKSCEGHNANANVVNCKNNETNEIKAQRCAFSKRVPILFVLSTYMFFNAPHKNGFDVQDGVSKLYMNRMAPRNLATQRKGNKSKNVHKLANKKLTENASAVENTRKGGKKAIEGGEEETTEQDTEETIQGRAEKTSKKGAEQTTQGRADKTTEKGAEETTQERAKKVVEAVKEKENYIGTNVTDNTTSSRILQELSDDIDNANKKGKEKLQHAPKRHRHRKKKLKESEEEPNQEKNTQEQLCGKRKIVDNHAQRLPEYSESSVRYNTEEHVDDSDERHELLFQRLRTLKKYTTPRAHTFYYEYIYSRGGLSNYEIDIKLGEMEEVPKKRKLCSLYWQSYRNEQQKYFAVREYLVEKFLELRKEQSHEAVLKYNEKWEKSEEIVGNNFTEQHQHVADVFYTFVGKEKFSRDNFKEILKDMRASWKEVTRKTRDECVALFEEPVVLGQGVQVTKPSLRTMIAKATEGDYIDCSFLSIIWRLLICS
ncbi:hypothetical protein C922_04478 [Plasmodium inui San Antonio 1]|uniref:Plasmodium RESA N-terminal domain-containing protein n=1 Tax=Plasmodium inui San Antonio 1 TaxID=1237626 RepID=W7A194_9APIC|nr:hypothetical protein C922_04478 [Plasmodium inui San Antonio 1]EUD65078.1 hypothetical protein C922_04478 [Plasmodium inui San Antonio 1]